MEFGLKSDNSTSQRARILLVCLFELLWYKALSRLVRSVIVLIDGLTVGPYVSLTPITSAFCSCYYSREGVTKTIECIVVNGIIPDID